MRNTAMRTAQVKGLGSTEIHATWTGGIYIDLHWFDKDGPVLDVINVYDYRAGEIKLTSVSQELTEWLKEHDTEELANYYRNTV